MLPVRHQLQIDDATQKATDQELFRVVIRGALRGRSRVRDCEIEGSIEIAKAVDRARNGGKGKAGDVA